MVEGLETPNAFLRSAQSAASNVLCGTNVILQQPFDRPLNIEIFYNRGDGKIIMVDGANAKYGAALLGDTK